MKINALTFKFVSSVPEQPENGILYVSMAYRTAIHKCCCGCGHEVVTPFSPTDWRITYDGKSVSLHPSIGNWSLPCKSHYWIDRNNVSWADQWSDEKIAAGRARDRANKERYYGQKEAEAVRPPAQIETGAAERKKGFWSRIAGWFS